MHLLSLLFLILSLLYFVTPCAPNGGLVPTPAPGGVTDAPGEEGEATDAPGGDEAGGDEKRRRRNVMRSSVEQIDHPLPDIQRLHKFLVRNDSVKVIDHDGKE